MSEFQAALAHHKAGRREEAKRAYEALLEREPGHVDARHHLALIHVEEGALDRGIALLRETVAARPDFPVAWLNLGLALGRAGRFAAAAEAFERAAALAPEQPEAHRRLADALSQLGRFEEAAGAYRSALRLQPAFVDAQFGLAMALKSLDRLDEAAEAYRRVIELQPGHRSAMTWLARVLLRLGRHTEGLAWLEETGGMIAFSGERGVGLRVIAPRARGGPER